MAKGNRRGHDRQTGTINPVLRPLAWSALLTATAAAAAATPAFATPAFATPALSTAAYAEPPLPDVIPDVGARPVPVGTFQLPGVGPATTQPAPRPPALTNDPIARAAYTKEVAVATLGDQLLEVRQQQQALTEKLAAATDRLRAAQDALARARETAEAMAAAALKEAAALPPDTYASGLHGLTDLSVFAPGPRLDVTVAEGDLTRAKAEEETASQEVRALESSRAEVVGRFTTLQSEHQRAEAGLLAYRRDNAAHLQQIDRLQEAYEQQLGANFVGRGSRYGMAAHASALVAVQYALAQLGDPYLWSTEGPDSFDCSGLMWAAYRSAGFELPRVSRDQFYATRSRLVSRYDLLPGDLIFFASGSDWTTIHHVGMYIGDGRMVHAPRTGDVVKISTVWWSRFYAATRVFGEVPAPGLPSIIARPPAVNPPMFGVPTPPVVGVPTPPPTTAPAPSPSRTPTTSPTSPGPTSPTPAPTSPSPSPSSPSPSPTSPSPSPSSPSPSPSSPSPSPTSPTASPTSPPSSPTETSTAEPTTSPTPEPTASSGSTDGSTGSTDGTSAPAPSDSPTTDSSSPTSSVEPSAAPTTTASSSASTGGS